MITAGTGSLRVLLVDDDASVCDLIGDVFDSFVGDEIELKCVHSDTAAHLALAEEASFDPILVDINLGRGTTGYDVARRARALWPDVGVIYISGQIDARSVAKNGVSGSKFLAKPFTAQQLLAALGVDGESSRR